VAGWRNTGEEAVAREVAAVAAEGAMVELEQQPAARFHSPQTCARVQIGTRGVLPRAVRWSQAPHPALHPALRPVFPAHQCNPLLPCRHLRLALTAAVFAYYSARGLFSHIRTILQYSLAALLV